MSSAPDNRRDGVGLPYRAPSPEQAAAQYLNRSMHKVHLAEYHLREFERLEDALESTDFFDFEREPFLPVQAHADGVLVQLSAAFDAFACAVAHRRGCLKDPEKADFQRHAGKLADAEPGELSDAIREIRADSRFDDLCRYRNLAAHRGTVGEQQWGSADEVRLHLPEWLPPEFPDFPGYSVRPILRRYVDWAREQVERLQGGALEWNLEDEPSGELIEEESAEFPSSSKEDDAAPPDTTSLSTWTDRFRQDEWEAWFFGGSFDFATDTESPPAWFLRRGDGPEQAKLAVGLDVEELRRWLESHAGPEIAKGILWDFRPREVRTNLGRALFPKRQT
jgi:hypothetical protein